LPAIAPLLVVMAPSASAVIGLVPLPATIASPESPLAVLLAARDVSN
jgi:hypothetical protein